MGKTLLLADDSVTIQKVVGISFASEDIAIKTVDNGDDAITRARELRPDIILADVVMPGKSGYEVCEAIKGDAELRHIPVLLLTGTFEAFDEDRALRAGASGHIAKPFEAQTLVERVKQLLAQPPTVASVAPVAPPEPQPAQSASAPTGAAAGGENAFDFFDDPAPEALGAQSDLEMDDPSDAFAFDEDDLGGAPEFVPGPAAGSQEPVAHTVAILPDTPESADFRDDDLEPMAPESVGQALDPAPPPVPTSTATAGEGFDFEFESMPSSSGPAAQDAGAEDFAESVLLDPSGDSAYDVSSSQLGDLSVEPEPEPASAPEAPAATRLFEPPPLRPPHSAEPSQPAAVPPHSAEPSQPAAVPPLQPAPQQPAAVPPLQQPAAVQPPQIPTPAEPAPLTPPAAPPRSAAPVEAAGPPPLPLPGPDPALEALAADPVAAGPAEPSAAFVDEVPTQPPSRSVDPMPFPAADDATDPEPEWPEPADDEPEWPEPAPEIQASPPEVAAEPAAAAGVEISDDSLAQIAPALRQQLHETLEKIAWEAFGQVTETVVAQTVERLEKIAWEVVPKLAETLIAEEIRKLKDDA